MQKQSLALFSVDCARESLAEASETQLRWTAVVSNDVGAAAEYPSAPRPIIGCHHLLLLHLKTECNTMSNPAWAHASKIVGEMTAHFRRVVHVHLVVDVQFSRTGIHPVMNGYQRRIVQINWICSKRSILQSPCGCKAIGCQARHDVRTATTFWGPAFDC